MSRNPKVREVRAWLLRLGCKRVRCKGSHETWEAPNGRPCSIKINHLGDDMSARVLSRVRRWLQIAGLDLDGN